MEFQHVWAVVIRHARLLRYDPNRILSTLYWPLLGVLTWGFVGSWVQHQQQVAGLAEVFLLGVLLWDVVVRIGVRIGCALLEELWTNNMVNMFASSLRLSEWIMGIVLFSLFIALVSAVYCMGLIWFLYPVSLVVLFKNFLIFSPPLLLSGIWLGLITLSLIISFGKGAQEMVFIVGWFFAPFSAVYYPLESLPLWAQKISICLPMSAVFEGMRAFCLYHQDPTPFLVKAYIISSIYAGLTLLLFLYMFGRSNQKGLARLHD